MKGVPVALAALTYRRNFERLTVQERRMLGHMLNAESSKETARRLGIAVSTTKNLRSRVLDKMMAATTGSLLVIAAQAHASSPPLHERA